jgi:hypothetical protein
MLYNGSHTKQNTNEESKMKTYKLAADTINGVYEVSYFEPGAQIITRNFIDYIDDDFEGFIFGEVTQDEYDEIDSYYGIKF